MGLHVDRLEAAGRVIDRLPDPSTIASVRVDGQRVDNIATAVIAYRFAKRPDPQRTSNFLDRGADKLHGKLDSLRAKLSTNRIGRSLLACVTADPEHVSRTVPVEIAYKDGRRTEVSVEVTHRAETKWLQGLSGVSEAVAMVPVVGYFVPPLTAALAAAGSGIARLVGRMPLAKALMRTAAKHAVLGGAGLIPVLGTASAALAAVIDHRDFQESSNSPSIADIVQLGRKNAPSPF